MTLVHPAGASGEVANVGSATAAALHITTKPTPYGALGHYALSATSGTMTTTGGSGAGEMFQARWTDTTAFAAIYGFTLEDFRSAGTAFPATSWRWQLTVARNWTVDGSGGTALTLTGNDQKLQTSMGTSLFGTLRIGQLFNAGLGTGTKTFDAHDLKRIDGIMATTANAKQLAPIPAAANVTVGYTPGVVLFARDPSSEHPLLLGANEGVCLQVFINAAVNATYQFTVSMKWLEVAAY